MLVKCVFWENAVPVWRFQAHSRVAILLHTLMAARDTASAETMAFGLPHLARSMAPQKQFRPDTIPCSHNVSFDQGREGRQASTQRRGWIGTSSPVHYSYQWFDAVILRGSKDWIYYKVVMRLEEFLRRISFSELKKCSPFGLHQLHILRS